MQKAEKAFRIFNKRRMAAIVIAWRATVHEAKERGQRAEEMLLASQQAHVRTCVVAWLQYCLQRQRYREIIITGLDTYSTRLTRTALQSWLYVADLAR
jgi:hypothetical protein